MSAAEKAIHSEVSIFEIASECLQRARGNRERAATLMRDRIKGDQELLDQLIEPLLERAVTTSVNAVIRRTRAACERTISRDDPRGLLSIANNERHRWFDYPLSSGKKLGDATKLNLTDEADMHASLARGNLVKTKFYRMLAQRIGTKRVRDALDDDQITSAWNKVNAETV